MTGEWRRQYNEEICDPCSSSSIILVVKSGRMRWVKHCSMLSGEEKCIHVDGV